MGILDVTDHISRGVGAVTETLTAPFADPTIRLGVTGLSRAGKTVFITSLVANLMDRGRMPQLTAAVNGAIQAAYLQPQPDDTLPRFDYETHLRNLTGQEPAWPDGTRHISELRLSFKIQPPGRLSGFQSPRTLHLDIVDYPGEWLLDLALLDQDYATWSQTALSRVQNRPAAADFLAQLETVDANAKLDEVAAQALAKSYTAHLIAAREAGYSDCSPGRFILPGDLAGSPVLTFAPLPEGHYARGSLGREFARRYESYKRNVVRPFFRDHFSKIDRQVILIDVLGAIHAGPPALADLRQAMSGILNAFRPGRNKFLNRIFQGRRVEKILFAATKADHLHHTQHPQLTAITQNLLREAKDRADFAGAKTAAVSLAALRTTVEDTVTQNGEELRVVKGRLLVTNTMAAFHPGQLPQDPSELLTLAEGGAKTWDGPGYEVMRFAPAPQTLRPDEGPPHIRLDKAAEFLLGDKL